MPPPRLGTAQMSQIVVRRLFDTDNVYVFQNSDRRLIFASSYERDFTLIGTVGHAFKGDPAIVRDGGRRRRLSSATPRTAIFASGSRPSTWCGRFPAPTWSTNQASQAVARDGAMTFDARTRQGAADHDLRRRRHHLAAARGASRLEPDAVLSDVADAGPRRRRCPAAISPGARFETEVDEARERWRFLSEDQARRLVAAYGSNV